MNDREREADRLFEAARNLPADEQIAYLDVNCTDPDVRALVEQRIVNDAPTADSGPVSADDILTTPVNGNGHANGTPARVGPYRVLRELGRGGMGVVYLGERDEASLRSYAAIKVMKRGTDTEEILTRFQLERQVLASLSHPNVVTFREGGETDDGLPYLATEYIDGRPLDQYCDSRKLRVAERLSLFRKVCNAVQHAHNNMFLHRDLKPSNILVTKEGEPKVLDFGIAKWLHPGYGPLGAPLTAPNLRLMTPEYASPEQVKGEPVATSSDVYSLGVLLYELLSGHRPYQLRRRSRMDVERIICDEEPERPSTKVTKVTKEERLSLSDEPDTPTTTITPDFVARARGGEAARLQRRLQGDLDAIVLKALRKSPDRRYQSPADLAEDIQRHLNGEPVKAAPDTFVYRMSKYVRRNRRSVLAAAVMAVLVLGWATTATAGYLSAVEEQERKGRMRSELIRLANVLVDKAYDKLQRIPGTTAARLALVEPTLDYVESAAEDLEPDPELLSTTARLRERVGDTLGGVINPNRGQRAEAMTQYRAAEDLRRDVLAMKLDAVDPRRRLGSVLTRIGVLQRHMGDLTDAEAAHEEALGIFEKLASDDSRFERPLAAEILNLARVAAARGDLDRADEFCRRAVATYTALLPKPIEPQRLRARDLSVAYETAGDIAELREDFAAAAVHFRAAEALRLPLDEQNGDNRTRRDLAVTRFDLARVTFLEGETDRAAEDIEPVIRTLQEARDENPDDFRSVKDLGLAYELRGRIALARSDPSAADDFTRFHELCKELIAIDENPETLDLIARSRQRLAEWRTAAEGDER
ncbi:MAG: serine/threonine protein kinase [Planctomycetes bacterium]|nr:serine/threonine protein kinase [Planctomycetota bacterium]